jgi:hypothetical protein
MNGSDELIRPPDPTPTLTHDPIEEVATGLA